MKKKLLIIGAGGHGRCCLDIAREMNQYEQIAFLDDGCVGKIINDSKVIGTIAQLSEFVLDFDEVFVAIGNNCVRETISNDIRKERINMATLVSTRSVVSPYATIEPGVVLYPNVVVEANAMIGQGSVVTANTSVHHDSVLKAFSIVYSNTVIRPNAIVGSKAKVGNECVITANKVIDEKMVVPDGTIL